MSLDDLVLSAQRTIDRLAHRLSGRDRAAPPRRRFLIVQIDGLSRAALEQGLSAGHMPFVRRLLNRGGGYRLEPMSVGLPTSTPAFQMAAMYGVRPDIPGFHYYDRDRAGDIHFPRPGHAAYVESKQASGRRGILAGGSVYGCCFTGGADNDLFSFARLMQPNGRGVLRALSPMVVVAWVTLKNSALTVLELAKAVGRLARHPVAGRDGWRWTTMKIGISVWIRGYFTLAVSRDLYAGTPAIYVNFVDYDVAAHAFGPRSGRAMLSLRRIDRSIRKFARVMRRAPEHGYDLYILADHGQVACTPYMKVNTGCRFERWIFDRLLHPAGAAQADPAPQFNLARGMHAQRRGAVTLIQHYYNYLEEDFVRRLDSEAYQRDGVRVISAGPNALLYVLGTKEPLDEESLERRFPNVCEDLSRSPGVGVVLVRSNNGAVCFCEGRRYEPSDADPAPFASRDDAVHVVRGIRDLMAMRSAGDVVIYGTDAPEGHVSFLPEHGAHAGPSQDEMQTFIVHPKRLAVPLPITHPIQLYDHFIRYQQAH